MRVGHRRCAARKRAVDGTRYYLVNALGRAVHRLVAGRGCETDAVLVNGENVTDTRQCRGCGSTLLGGNRRMAFPE